MRAEALAAGDGPLDTLRARDMKVTDLVWKETLRLYPVAGFLPRRPLREVTIAGHTIAPGTLVFVASGAMGRHPAWWTEPSRFDPDRFSPERAEDKKHPALYNPFGGGAHVCIGAQLATMEVKAYWHDLLRRCRVRLASDEERGHSAAPLGIIAGPVDLVLEPLGS
jgi:cytochrome P450